MGLGRVTPPQFSVVCRFVGGTQLPPDYAEPVLEALDYAARSAGINPDFDPYVKARTYLEGLVARAEHNPRSMP